jgi:uncharacterized membrane protein
MSSPSRTHNRPAWLAFALAALLAALALVLRPDGQERSEPAQFLGRFHSVLVHVPIALLAVMPLLEIGGLFRRWSHLRASAGFVLWLAAFGALFAAFDGWLLARSGGYLGGLVTRHMWRGVALAAVTVVAAAARSKFVGRSQAPEGDGSHGGITYRSPIPYFLIYWPLLLFSTALMVSTGRLGGDITHGDGYLTELMPPRLRALLRMPAAAPRAAPEEPARAPSTVYAARIEPLLERSCISCHNPRKTKGGLRLDSYALLMKGGEDGPVIVPWDPMRSDLIRRVTLPPSDDDSMPSNGRKRFTPAEVKLFEQWIAAGASSAQPLGTLP